MKCPALWTVNKNQVGVHLTLFWPTEISDENTAKLKKLTDEERMFITQNPALLEFILNQKKIKEEQKVSLKPEILVIYPLTQENEIKRPAEAEDLPGTPPPLKIPKLETDSGLNSITSNSPKDKPTLPSLPVLHCSDKKSDTKSVNEDEAEDPDPDQEVKSEEAAEVIGKF